MSIISTPHFLVDEFEERQQPQARRSECSTRHASFNQQDKPREQEGSLYPKHLAVAKSEAGSGVLRKSSQLQDSTRKRRQAKHTKLQLPPKGDYFSRPPVNTQQVLLSTPKHYAEAVSSNHNLRKQSAASESEFQEPFAREQFGDRNWGCQCAQAPSEIYQGLDINQTKLETNQSGIRSVCSSHMFPNLEDDNMEHEPEILLQPETRPISYEQLFLEAKGIYAGILIVESKCIEEDSKSKADLERDPSNSTKLSNEKWQALITLHKTLLHQHHDFFLVSQHPSAAPALTKLPEYYSMPARMWRHGVHSFLEVLRHRLPESLDHMLAFIYIAYSMFTLLYETVLSFESTWIERLGDLGRYRMVIENDMQDRKVWSGVARSWYSKGVDKDPDQGRLYHHLAILTSHSSLQQLSLYLKALTCVTPFESARKSIMTLFVPILSGGKDFPYRGSITFEAMFIKVHAMLFSGTALETFDADLSRLNDLFDTYITKSAAKFKERGIFIAIANISALLEYGGGLRSSDAAKSILPLCFKSLRDAEDRAIKEAKAGDFDLTLLESIKPSASNMGIITPSELETSLQFITRALKLAFGIFQISLRQICSMDVLPLIGVYFMFIWELTRIEDLHGIRTLIINEVPWRDICSFLNTIVKFKTLTSRVRAPNFSTTPKERPLPEDFLMRGQWYFPSHRFSGKMLDEEERAKEVESNATKRMERILWLGFHMDSPIRFNEKVQQFEVKNPKRWWIQSWLVEGLPG